MAKNYISEVAKMLGLEIGEKFDIIDTNGREVGFGPYKFTEDALLNGMEVESVMIFYKILTGNYNLQRCAWKPKDGSIYYFIDIDGLVSWQIYRSFIDDLSRYHMGNCFPTKTSAMAGEEKILAKLEDIRKEVWNDE